MRTLENMMGRLGIVVAALALCIAIRSTRQHANTRYFDERSYEDVYYLPPASWLPVLSAGYNAAVADLLWVRALIYFGQEIAHRGEVAHLFEYADAIVSLDPDFKAAYEWVSVAALYKTSAATEEEGRRAVEYLERAVRRWPDDGELAWSLGSTLRFELPALLQDDAAKRDARLRGAEHMVTAARLGAGPEWLPLTTATTFEKQGRTEQAIRHLEEMYDSVSDPNTKATIEHRLTRLKSRAYADHVRSASQAFEAERRANYPYMSPGLFLVLGPRPQRAWFDAVARGFRPADDVDLLDEGPAPADEPSAR